jgi:hypothetical protein
MGCGWIKIDGFWNVDIEQKCNPDEILDLEITPWPYADNFFEEINANQILEHLGQTPEKFLNVIKEMYRVSKDKCEWNITVPHYRSDSFWNDYTHVRIISDATLELFDQKYNYYCIQERLADSTHGLYHGIDLEITQVFYELFEHWIKLEQQGILDKTAMIEKIRTNFNIVRNMTIKIKVHKPGRYDEIFI